MLPGLIVGGVVLLLVLWVAGLYNGLVKLRQLTRNAWSQIDVQLKRRYDLVPNLDLSVGATNTIESVGTVT